MHRFCTQPPGDSREFSVSYFDLTPTSAILPADVVLTGATSNLAKKVAADGKLLSNRRCSVQGFPGREVTLVTRDRVFIAHRMFVKNRRFYQMIVTEPDEQAPDADAVKFLRSFRFLQKR